MSEPDAAHGKKRKRWQRVKRLAVGLALLIGLVILFHRPLMHHGGVWLLKRWVKEEHLEFTGTLTGAGWGELELQNFQVWADSSGKAEVEVIRGDWLRAEYSFWKLVRGDIDQAVTKIEAGKLNGVVIPRNKNEPQMSPADDFRKILGDLKLPGDRLQIGRLDLDVKGKWKVRGLRLNVARNSPGLIAWENLDIIGIPSTGEVEGALVVTRDGVAIKGFRVFGADVEILEATRGNDTLVSGGMRLLAGIGEGEVRGTLVSIEKDLQLEVNASHVALKFLESKIPQLPRGSLMESLALQLTGNPEDLKTWKGKLVLNCRSPASEKIPGGTAVANIEFDGGTIALRALNISMRGASATAGGSVVVENTEEGLQAIAGALTFTLDAPDLSDTPFAANSPIQGSVRADGVLNIQLGKIQSEINITGANLRYGGYYAEAAQSRLTIQRSAAQLEDIWHSLAITGTLQTGAAMLGTVPFDSINYSVFLAERKLTVRTLEFLRGENTISATAEWSLDEREPKARNVNFILKAPRFEEWRLRWNGAVIGGAVYATAALDFSNGEVSGPAHIDGHDIRVGEVIVGNFDVDSRAQSGVLNVSSVQIDIAGAGIIEGSGQVSDFAAARFQTYTGEARVALNDLHKLEPLLRVLGIPMALGGIPRGTSGGTSGGTSAGGTSAGGILTAEWNGSLANGEHTGEFNLQLKNVLAREARVDDVRIVADYGQANFRLREFQMRSGGVELSASASWEKGRFISKDLLVEMDGVPALTGAVDLPFAPSQSVLLPNDQPLAASLQANNLNGERLFGMFGRKPLLRGVVNFDLKASGTVVAPEMHLNASVRSLTGAGLEQLDPAVLELKADLREEQLQLTGQLVQKQIRPLSFSASVPVPTEGLFKRPFALTNFPISGHVVLPASSLDNLAKFIPAIARVDGTVAADVNISGTVGEPKLDGFANLDVNVLRMANENIPRIADIVARINFKDDQVSIATLRGTAGGGTFTASGGATVVSGKLPVVDIRVNSKKILVMRDDTITVRADAELAAVGPLDAGKLTGTIHLTQSRILKEVDILPLSLPGRDRPRVRNIPAPKQQIVLPLMFRRWEFDVAIRTRVEDPILIRGNIARGAIVPDLRLRGSGAEPYLEGQVEITNFRGSLPAGTLEMTRGVVTFNESAPFEAQLDLQAESMIRGYRISASVSGGADNPQLDLHSEPPLPQHDILSLLTTGTTSGDVGSNADALAARAGMMVLQRWYRQIFKKDPLARSSSDSIWGRFQVDTGSVDARTGRPEVTGTLKATDRIYFIVDLDLEGQFSGRIKYLVRFR